MVTSAKALKRIIPLIAGLAVITSCVHEAEIDGPGSANIENTTFYLELPGPLAVQTRGTTGSESENRISSLHLLVFTDGDILDRIVPVTNLSNATSDSEYQSDKKNVWKFSARVDRNAVIMALANVSDKIGAINTGDSREEVAAAFQYTTNPTEPWAAGTPIPMWGELPNGFDPNDSSTRRFKMVRMLARINVTVEDHISDFRMTSLFYFNYNTRGFVIPEYYSVQADGSIAITSPSDYGTDPGKQITGINYSLQIDDARSCIENIYVFEAASTGDFPAPGADFYLNTGWKESPCLVIGGIYNGGQETFYRIDFLVKVSDTGEVGSESLSLLRNHSYNVSITDVIGDGYPELLDALGSAPFNLYTEIYKYNESETSAMAVDGPYRLSVSESELSLWPYLAEADHPELLVKTNYQSWEASVYDDSACTALSTWLWLAAEGNRQTGEQHTTEGSPLKIIADNNGREQRTAYIKFTSGRMALVIKVTQQALNPGANTYVVNRDKTDIIIPVSQAGWALINPGESGYINDRDWMAARRTGTMKAAVLWSDVNTFESSNAVVRKVTYTGAGNINDCFIKVTPGDAVGNALVILYEDINGDGMYSPSVDIIRWSWHIWSGEGFYPYNSISGKPSMEWLDRNLGAVTSTPGILTTLGFQYQWGRKDPYPGPDAVVIANGQAGYHQMYFNPSVVLGSMGFGSSNLVSVNNGNNIPDATANPTLRYCQPSGYLSGDWYANSSALKNNDLWGDNGAGSTDTGFIFTSNGKSVYDPCPDGYRTPRTGEWGSSGLGQEANGGTAPYGLIYSDYGGYFPAAGYREGTTEELADVGTYGTYWYGSAGSSSLSVRSLGVDTETGKIQILGSTPTRARSLPVRCIAEGIVDPEPSYLLEQDANCYFVKGAGIPIVIPLSHVGVAMGYNEDPQPASPGNGFLGTNWITDYSALKVMVLWSDVSTFDNSAAVVNTVSYNGKTVYDGGIITVTPGSAVGNSLVILYEDTNLNSKYDTASERIIWSWHIWSTTDYYPYNSSSGKPASHWLDRHLGAATNINSDKASYGFLYQWGRKDPYPGTSGAAMYYNTGKMSGTASFTTTTHTSAENLPTATLRPTTRYYNTSGYNWYTNSTSGNSDLWGGAGTSGFLSSLGKSVYDPCPPGYCVPKQGEFGPKADWPSDLSGPNNSLYGGSYPLSGKRAHNGNGESGAGVYGYCWMATASGSDGMYMQHGGNSLRTEVTTDNNTPPSTGHSVRCIAEDGPGYPDPESIVNRFAKSNIVLHPTGDKLTFNTGSADDEVVVPANVQGLQFKWGSLIGLGCTMTDSGNTIFASNHIKFNPTGRTISTWGTIPYAEGSNYTDSGNYGEKVDEFKTYNDGTGWNETAGRGDICRYITAKGWVTGKWRLPTAREWGLLLNETYHAGVKYGLTSQQAVSYTTGWEQMENGYWYGSGVDTGTSSLDNMADPPENTIFLPASGTRLNNDGSLRATGTMGMYWSASPFSTINKDLYAYHVRFDSDGRNQYNYMTYRPAGYAVRCILDDKQ